MVDVPYYVPINQVFVLELICFGKFTSDQITYLQEVGLNIIQQIWPALFDRLKGVRYQISFSESEDAPPNYSATNAKMIGRAREHRKNLVIQMKNVTISMPTGGVLSFEVNLVLYLDVEHVSDPFTPDVLMVALPLLPGHY